MSLSLLKSTLGPMPAPCVLIDKDDRIAFMNSAAEKILGEAHVTKHYITVLRQPFILDAIENAFAVDDASEDVFEERFTTTKNDQDYHYMVRCHKVAQTYVLLTFEDISEQQRVEQIRRDFVANVSHELKTPLTAMLGFLETLQGPAQDDPTVRARFLEIMSIEAERMNRLVSDLLSLNRVEATERIKPKETVNLSTLLASVVRNLAPIIERKECHIDILGADQEINIIADSDQLQQVFSNLIENAIKYGEAGNKIEVTLNAPKYLDSIRKEGVEISIKDNGPGISFQHIPRLTERFYRADSHRSRCQGGTGLGLAIVKHILNRHLGRLKIESVLGQGSVFTVLLPTLRD